MTELMHYFLKPKMLKTGVYKERKHSNAKLMRL
jgi:hypothetical protein